MTRDMAIASETRRSGRPRATQGFQDVTSPLSSAESSALCARLLQAIAERLGAELLSPERLSSEGAEATTVGEQGQPR